MILQNSTLNSQVELTFTMERIAETCPQEWSFHPREKLFKVLWEIFFSATVGCPVLSVAYSSCTSEHRLVMEELATRITTVFCLFLARISQARFQVPVKLSRESHTFCLFQGNIWGEKIDVSYTSGKIFVKSVQDYYVYAPYRSVLELSADLSSTACS